MSSPYAIRSAAAIAGLALLAGLSLMLAAGSADASGYGLLAVGCLVGLIVVAAPAARTRSLRLPDGEVRGDRRRPSRSAAGAAGAAVVLGLLLVLASDDLKLAGLVVTAAGLIGSAVLAAPSVAATLRRLVWPALAIALVAAAIVAVIRLSAGSLDVGSVVPTYAWELAVLFGAGAGGLLLLADALAAGLRGPGADRSGWSLITRTGRGSAAGRRSATAWRSVGGALMILWATGFGIALAASQVDGHPALVILSALGVVVAAIVVIGTPLLVTAYVSRQRAVAESTREAERARIAAHLHDSVLQTLALVQRQSRDPDAVARLARRQELSLRNWMAGESELEAGSLAAALRALVFEVEDDTGASIELSMVGDRPTEPRDEALVAATREALRNAARHARGSPARVYAEVMDLAVEVYVSDDGPGFLPDEVPETRRGIRDAILARMRAVGGSAEVLAEPGHGTEVTLRLPTP